jgi:ribulose-phosphate 3-epimerase
MSSSITPSPEVRAIVSPSVLASNFADLGNEIKRMMHCGAEWVHMGALKSLC